jgi:uncharacterized membrane protein
MQVSIEQSRQQSEHTTKSTRLATKQSQRDGDHSNVGNTERVFSSLIGGALLLSALRSPSPASALRVLGGSALLHRGVTGHCYMYSALGRNTATSSNGRGAVERSITIGRSAEELYGAWRDPKHIEAIMGHFARVQGQGAGRFLWTVSLPRGRELSWTTRVTTEVPGQLIAWRTEPDAPFAHEGSVRFQKAPNDLGTEVTLSMTLGAEGGLLGSALRALTGKWLRTVPRTLEESILRRCKSLCEAGEIPTLERNPAARKAARLERSTKPKSNAAQPHTMQRSLS